MVLDGLKWHGMEYYTIYMHIAVYIPVTKYNTSHHRMLYWYHSSVRNSFHISTNYVTWYGMKWHVVVGLLRNLPAQNDTVYHIYIYLYKLSPRNRLYIWTIDVTYLADFCFTSPRYACMLFSIDEIERVKTTPMVKRVQGYMAKNKALLEAWEYLE